MKFHKKGLWALAAFILLLVAATGQTAMTIGVAVAAAIVLELLTWRGVFGRGGKSGRCRRPDGPRLLSGV